jgi:hypothetical protein
VSETAIIIDKTDRSIPRLPPSSTPMKTRRKSLRGSINRTSGGAATAESSSPTEGSCPAETLSQASPT